MNRLSESLLWLAHLANIGFRGHNRHRREPPASLNINTLTATFESLYREFPDPWSYQANWYERTRQELASSLFTGQPQRLLDLGCGEGRLTERVSRRFPEATIVGLDASPTAIKRAGARAPKALFKVLVLGRDSLQTLGQFDAIIACDILSYGDEEHLPRMLRDLDHLLLPGGQLIVSLCPRYHQGLIDRLCRDYRLEAERRIRDLTWVARLRKAAGKTSEV